jgi:sulfur carrier protein ThiS
MQIKIYGVLRTFRDGNDLIDIKIDGQKRVRDIIEILKIPDNYVSLIVREGRPIGKDSIVADADRISIVALLDGA